MANDPPNLAGFAKLLLDCLVEISKENKRLKETINQTKIMKTQKTKSKRGRKSSPLDRSNPEVRRAYSAGYNSGIRRAARAGHFDVLNK